MTTPVIERRRPTPPPASPTLDRARAAAAKGSGDRRPLAPMIACWTWGVILLGVPAIYLDHWDGFAWVHAAMATGGAVIVGATAAGVRGGATPALLTAVGVTGLGMVGAGIAPGGGGVPTSLAGVLVVALTGLAWALLGVLGGRPAAATADGPGSAREELAALRAAVDALHEHVMLSDSAKRVLFRERELALLRSTIEQDAAAGRWDVALSLCEEMAEVFGAREEAEQYRAKILGESQARTEEAIGRDLAALDQLLEAGRWQEAHEHAARIKRLYPESHLLAGIDQRFVHARERHRASLEQTFLEATQRGDVEQAMAALRHLDHYLSREDAARFRELAEGVVTRHRENLGVQFKLAVNDRRWDEAVRVGEAIMAEFPNSRMAEEVRSMIDVLRTRAADPGSPDGPQEPAP